MSVREIRKNQKEKEGVTYLSQLGKVSVPVRKVLQIEQKEKPLLQEEERLNTVNQ
jgi:hypothetical protein